MLALPSTGESILIRYSCDRRKKTVLPPQRHRDTEAITEKNRYIAITNRRNAKIALNLN